jgi:hypothetical protein
MGVPSLCSGGNQIVNRRARGGGNSNCRWRGNLIVADQEGVREMTLVFSIPTAAIIGALWLVSHNHRQLAAYSFGTVAIIANLTYAAACIAPQFPLYLLLCWGWPFIVGPTLASLGSAWAGLATRPKAQPRRDRRAAWSTVIVLTLMPIVTALTCWPFQLAFQISKPSLRALADQVAANQPVTFPQQAGLFRIVTSRIDADSGNIALVIDPNPNGPTAFVRVNPNARPNGPYHSYRPIRGDAFELILGGGWYYNQED